MFYGVTVEASEAKPTSYIHCTSNETTTALYFCFCPGHVVHVSVFNPIFSGGSRNFFTVGG